MPPKKDDKKGGGKAPPKEVDPTSYKRTPLTLDDLPADLISPGESGQIINVETLFPEWSIEGEDWSVGVEDDKTEELRFADHIDLSGAEFKSLKTMLVPESEEPAGGKKDTKKDNKKGAPVAVEMTEATRDDAGNLLPKMYLESNFDSEGTDANDEESRRRKYNWSFTRMFSKEQLDKKVHQFSPNKCAF